MTARRLVEAGLGSLEALARCVPHRWDDLRSVQPVDSLVEGVPQLCWGRVARARVQQVFRRRLFEVVLESESGAALVLSWFRFRGTPDPRFDVGRLLLVSGVARRARGRLQMVHPETTPLDAPPEPSQGAIRPRYRAVEGVPARLVERLCLEAARRLVESGGDVAPAAVLRRLGLGPLGEALLRLHAPPSELSPEELAALVEGRSPWQRRLLFEELFVAQLRLAEQRQQVVASVAWPASRGHEAVARLLAQLPYRLTSAQQRVLDQLLDELHRSQPMQRLLQGDVGSGKTVVAWAACEAMAQSGLQTALLVPTELLAEQHAATLRDWATRTGRRLGLLTASTPRRERAMLLAQLAAGELDVLLGTHALLSEEVRWHRLGLVIIDEQHRFGVAQRALLGARVPEGGPRPHLLVMSATPIPRTLALTLHGALDVCFLDELPPGRKLAALELLRGASGRSQALSAVRQLLTDEGQAFWVCPLIEESAALDSRAVTATATWLSEELDVEVGLLHGRLRPAEREQVMERFRRGELAVLVATTVIEVGVDVPRARLMVIEGAERFGLAQLHQLRGRVGRGGGASRCLLVTTTRDAAALARLAALVAARDGAAVAELDLQTRGDGELFGTTQAGRERFDWTALRASPELLEAAQREARALFEADPTLAAHPLARHALERGAARAQRFGAEAG